MVHWFFTLLSAMLLAAGLAVWITHRVDLGTVAACERDAARAQVTALASALRRQKMSDAVSLAAAVADARAQQRILTRTVLLTKEIPIHVTPAQDARLCLPYGLVRVLDSAALAADPGRLALAPGQSDDTCASVKASDLARSVAGNYAASRANAEQLTALQGWLRAQSRLASASNAP
jgi:hypothetical protein